MCPAEYVSIGFPSNHGMMIGPTNALGVFTWVLLDACACMHNITLQYSATDVHICTCGNAFQRTAGNDRGSVVGITEDATIPWDTALLNSCWRDLISRSLHSMGPKGRRNFSVLWVPCNFSSKKSKFSKSPSRGRGPMEPECPLGSPLHYLIVPALTGEAMSCTLLLRRCTPK